MPSTLLLAPGPCPPPPPQFLRPSNGPATSSVPFITLYNFSPAFVNEKNEGRISFHSLIRNIVKTNYFSFSIKERRNVKSFSGAISFFFHFYPLVNSTYANFCDNNTKNCTLCMQSGARKVPPIYEVL